MYYFMIDIAAVFLTCVHAYKVKQWNWKTIVSTVNIHILLVNKRTWSFKTRKRWIACSITYPKLKGHPDNLFITENLTRYRYGLRNKMHKYSNQCSGTSNKRNVLPHSDHTSYIEFNYFLLWTFFPFLDRTQVIPTYKGPLHIFTYNFIFHGPASNNV
jgi:hypothetical protein